MRIVLALVAFSGAIAAGLPIIALGLPFIVTAIVVRCLARVLEPRSLRWSEIFVFDPVVGWRARPNVEGYLIEDRDDVFRVKTDRDGWHGRGTVDEARVIVLGDSYAFGYGVDAERSFASISACRIKAVGAPGYNMVQELLLMREMGSTLAGKLIVWFAYFGNDLYDNLAPTQGGYRAPFVREVANGWEIVTEHVSAQRWSASAGRAGRQHLPILAELHAATYLAGRAYRACAFLIGEGAAICQQVGARLVVMTIPSPLVLDEQGYTLLLSNAHDPGAVNPDFPDRQFAQICAEVGVEHVPLKRFLSRRHFKIRDDHWTEAGHRVVATVIDSIYERRGARDDSAETVAGSAARR
jgi:hypothetical protein